MPTEKVLREKLLHLQETVPDLPHTSTYVLAEAVSEMLLDSEFEAEPEKLVLGWFDLFDALVEQPSTKHKLADQIRPKLAGMSKSDVKDCRPILLDILRLVGERTLAKEAACFYRATLDVRQREHRW